MTGSRKQRRGVENACLNSTIMMFFHVRVHVWRAWRASILNALTVDRRALADGAAHSGSIDLSDIVRQTSQV